MSILLISAGLWLSGGIDGDILDDEVRAAGKSAWPADRDSLNRRLYTDRKALLIYGSGNADALNYYQTFANNFSKRFRRMEIVPIADSQVTEAELAGNHIYLLGSVESNSVIRKMAQRLPLTLTASAFRFAGRDYSQPADRFSLFFPNLFNPEFAMTIAAANSDSTLTALGRRDLMRMFSPMGDYRIWRGRNMAGYGAFAQDGRQRWQFDAAQHRDFSAEERRGGAAGPYRFHLHNPGESPVDLEIVADRLNTALKRFREFFEIAEADIRPIDYHIYPTCEEKGLRLHDTRVTHADRSNNVVHTVIGNAMRGDNFMADATILYRRHLRAATLAVIAEGLPAYFSTDWHRRGVEYWAVRLHLSETMPSLGTLLNNERYGRHSTLLKIPAAASLVAFLIEKHGREKFISLYHDWQPSPEEIPALQAEWRSYLDRVAAGYRSAIEHDRANFAAPAKMQRGFCFAHEGYQIYNGYISKLADQALQGLADINCNAVSITPFSYMRSANRPRPFPFSLSPGSENDESIIYSIQSARRLGMTVMMKPHIWLGGNSWPGDIRMTTEQDWALFFEYYRNWILHYALMAEMYDCEILCVGVEMVHTTIEQPQRWRALLKEVRRLYSGKITYAANWGEEFEKATIWADLDYMGLNCYYPLSKAENPSDADLRAGAQAVAKKIEAVAKKHNRPLLFTEIGFTATSRPWQNPHEPHYGRPLNLEDQRRCYAAVTEVLSQYSWWTGIYWWKWPSYLSYGGSDNPDFTPNGKPTERLLKEWFGNLR